MYLVYGAPEDSELKEESTALKNSLICKFKKIKR